MYYMASFSGGKDSTAMVIRLIEEHKPLNEVVFFDTGMEFQAVYDVVKTVQGIVEENNIRFTRLIPDKPFLYYMLLHPTRKGQLGYEWCGRMCRWGTSLKTSAIDKYKSKIDDYILNYIGIASDEPDRIRDKNYPLVEWGMSEKDCLDYCHNHGIFWNQEGIELYSILDRLSCWCCRNKNNKELRNIYLHLPIVWKQLCKLQTMIDRPFRDDKSILDFDEIFRTMIF